MRSHSVETITPIHGDVGGSAGSAWPVQMIIDFPKFRYWRSGCWKRSLIGRTLECGLRIQGCTSRIEQLKLGACLPGDEQSILSCVRAVMHSLVTLSIWSGQQPFPLKNFADHTANSCGTWIVVVGCYTVGQ